MMHLHCRMGKSVIRRFRNQSQRGLYNLCSSIYNNNKHEILIKYCLRDVVNWKSLITAGMTVTGISSVESWGKLRWNAVVNPRASHQKGLNIEWNLLKFYCIITKDCNLNSNYTMICKVISNEICPRYYQYRIKGKQKIVIFHNYYEMALHTLWFMRKWFFDLLSVKCGIVTRDMVLTTMGEFWYEFILTC